jgi:hypothetical protein
MHSQQAVSTLAMHEYAALQKAHLGLGVGVIPLELLTRGERGLAAIFRINIASEDDPLWWDLHTAGTDCLIGAQPRQRLVAVRFCTGFSKEEPCTLVMTEDFDDTVIYH